MGEMVRRSGDTLTLIALSVVILAVATVLDRVLGVIYAQYTGSRLVVVVAIIAMVLGLTSLILSLATAKTHNR